MEGRSSPYADGQGCKRAPKPPTAHVKNLKGAPRRSDRHQMTSETSTRGSDGLPGSTTLSHSLLQPVTSSPASS